MRFYSNEIVFRGHPDKVCDQISGAILKECVRQDPNTHAGIEVAGGKGKIFITGEISTKANYDVENITKRVLSDIGYSTDYEIIDNIGKQSSDINQGVSLNGEIGAGDQGMMFGYACDDTPECLPTAMVILQKLSDAYDEIRKIDSRFKPDGKAQITGIYDDDFYLVKIKDFTISYQNTEKERIKTDKILKDIAKDICGEYGVEIESFHINPTGKFLIGGFDADAGLTGRKIVVDAYQSFGNVGGGCVDCETEYLTPNGWKRMDEYNEEDLVAQWNEGELEFVKPISYIKEKVDKFYKFETTQNINMVLSEKHNILYRTSKGNYRKKTTKEVLEEYYEKDSGCRIELPLWFNNEFNGVKGVKLTEDKIRVQVAFCADGTIGKSYCRIRIKKREKKERLEELLKKANIEYKVTKDDDYSMYYFVPPIKSKSLVECFKDVNKKQAEIICEEVFLWDGNRKNLFRTANKKDADFIQYLLMSTTNKNVSLYADDRIGKTYANNGKLYTRKSICYYVHILKHKYSSAFRKNNKYYPNLKISEYTAKDGKMYCINVPSHNLILRRKNRVFITGNCQNGKDPSKVDFSAAHKARQLAVRAPKEHNLKWCQVQLSYAIGIPKPLAIYIDSNKGYIEPREEWYDECKPKNIIKDLKLLEVDYEKLAIKGHFF